MTVTVEIDKYSLFNDLWSGGRDTLDDLTVEEVGTILDYLEEASICSEVTLTDVNDFFWFERDLIAELLGYNDYEELMNR